jgi:deoxyribodipyrimidine photo-lyase
MTDYSIVWFKRDLRTVDHAPLTAAAERGRVLCLAIIEPSIWASPDASRRQFEFFKESLRDLYRSLRALGAELHVLTGEVVPTLAAIHQAQPFSRLWSHEETGNQLSFERDRSVAHWCRATGVTWQELPQNGVIRRLKTRNRWSALRDERLGQLLVPEPDRLTSVVLPVAPMTFPSPEILRLTDRDAPERQRGGRHEALDTLDDFITRRARQYRGGISSPLSAPTACSRLSPYLSWGCLSMRETVQAIEDAANNEEEDSRLRQGLGAMQSRLAWHCHFIQKLESEPQIEWRNMHRGYDGLRESDWNPEHFERLKQGRTGWPLVDASVRMLDATGWINFRMRAMLVSVAAYPLWLHWREVGLWLARSFVDYEPGIHWSQMQMQSGTTGINTTRIYNPVKQARDHDPKGLFVRQWLPHLRRVPDSWIFEPWKMPTSLVQACGIPENDWVTPIVDLERATQVARDRVYARRRDPSVKKEATQVVEKHGSRKTLSRRPRRSPREAADQLGLDLG